MEKGGICYRDFISEMVRLETVRSLHEDIESLEIAAANILLDKSGRATGVAQDHAVVYLVTEIQERVSELTQFYNDEHSMRTDEIRRLSSDKSSDIWCSFYNRLRESTEAYLRSGDRIYSRATDIQYWYDQALLTAVSNQSRFSGEEMGGRFCDFNSIYSRFLNLKKLREYLQREFVQALWSKHIKRADVDSSFESFRSAILLSWTPIDYVTWLKTFDRFEFIPRHIKYRQEDFAEYLRELVSYLESFIERQRPLVELNRKREEFSDDFEKRWDAREIPGWEKRSFELPHYAIVTDRLFSTETAFKGHLGSRDYRKAFAKYESLSDESKQQITHEVGEYDRAAAKTEEWIKYLKNMLQDSLDDTIEHVTRKQARSAREISIELAAMVNGEPRFYPDLQDALSDASSSGGEEVDTNDRSIYNPKNIPLGPDGKPIPYWQYKLFGLEKEFRCEICGNHLYFGRRSFEKHFSEWRHINGLRALRIQNSNHFFGVTGIEDAIALNEKMRQQSASAIFNVEKDMECEDAMGNVMSYKSYQDLVRQGMA